MMREYTPDGDPDFFGAAGANDRRNRSRRGAGFQPAGADTVGWKPAPQYAPARPGGRAVTTSQLRRQSPPPGSSGTRGSRTSRPPVANTGLADTLYV